MEGVVETFSDGAQAMFGYSREEAVGKVRVSDVNEQYQLAIADMLLAPWKQADPEVGDNVFY
jgi:PAS domain-containing protein